MGLSGLPDVSSLQQSLEIPAAMRAEVDERDDFHCRFCGAVLLEAQRLHHHAIYSGTAVGLGSRRFHSVDNLITLDWGCHGTVHSNYRLWLPHVLGAIQTPGVTVLQLYRWDQRRTQR